MSEQTRGGVQVTALFRNMLNYYLDLDWTECNRLGKLFQAELELADWIEDDRGRQFDLAYSPVIEK